VSSVSISSLTPFTWYNIYIGSCTVAGCTSGPAVRVQTLSELPQNQSAPLISNITSTTVDVSWINPAVPFGIILRLVRSNQCRFGSKFRIQYSNWTISTTKISIIHIKIHDFFSWNCKDFNRFVFDMTTFAKYCKYKTKAYCRLNTHPLLSNYCDSILPTKYNNNYLYSKLEVRSGVAEKTGLR